MKFFARKPRRPLARPSLLSLLKLEDRSVPATIQGTAFNDIDSNGSINGSDHGIAGVGVYLDLNNNGIFEGNAATYTSTDVPKTIPETSPTPTTSVINIVSGATIADVNVTINISHTYDGDMGIFLISPLGTRVELTTNNGGSGANYAGTTFDDAAVNLITAGSAPFSGSFRPEGLLSALNGQSTAGTWTLEVNDTTNGDGGTINAWSLSITTTTAAEPSATTSSTGAYSFTGLAAGSYRVRPTATPVGFTQTSPGGDGSHLAVLANSGSSFTGNLGYRRPPSTIYGRVFNDLDADGVIDAGEAGQAGVTVYQDQNNNGKFDDGGFASPNVPVVISATGTPTVTSTLTVAGVGNVVDVNVLLNISHSWDEDLDIFLTSPGGTKIELATDVGGNGDNFTNTLLDDEAAVLITSGSAPFTGTFRPEGLLSGFDGSNGDGTWTLTVTDDTNQDGGTITGWSLIFPNGAENAVVSDSNGDYYFSGLAANTYRLRQANIPSGQSQTFPAASGPQLVTVSGSDFKTGINFGNRLAPAVFTGVAFSDANSNGTKDSGEAVLPNITVFLDHNQNGVHDIASEPSALTDGSGVYTFNNVPSGANYYVAAVTPGGGTLTAPIRNGLSVLAPVNTTKNSGDDNETTIAIDPTNPSRIFAAANGANGVVGTYSTDAGATWTDRQIPSGDTGIANTFCDANTAWDKFGNLWMTYLTDNVTTSLARSTDGGKSFTFIQDFGSSDHPSVAVGPSATAGQQTLAFQDNSGGGCRVVMMQINAAGVVGSPVTPGITPDSANGISGNFGDIVIGPAGQVAVVYVNSGSGQGPDNVYFNIDPDGTGPLPFGARSIVSATNIGGFDFLPAQPSRSVDSEPDLVWDTVSGSPYQGRLYCVYNDETVNENNDAEVFIRYSDNAGATWSPRIRVNDDATTNSQFLPRVAMDQSTGHLAVSFYDARNDVNNKLVHYYATASFDGGQTWAPNVKLSTGTSLAPGGNDFGDYNDIDYVAGRFVTSWGDNSNSTGDNPGGQDVYVGRVDVANNVKNHYVPGAVAGTTYSNLDFGFNLPASPAKVSGVTLNGTDTQRSMVRSMTVTFNQVVTAPVGAFTLTRQGGGSVSLGITNFDNSGGFSKITFNFTGGSVLNGSLTDGRYTLTINAFQVTNANGNLDGDGNGTAGGNYSLAGDTSNDLFRLFGDFDANGTVDATDFGFFPAFGAAANSAFDFNNNGDIDSGTDLAEFGNRFGTTI